jgi:glutamine---fructose-6-phosphate transaminase (isomerizing)
MAMTHFLRDILRQPEELRRTVEMLSAGEGHARLHEAVAAVRGARHVYLTGIGSSWHAALNVAAMFQLGARPVYTVDAAELLQFAAIPPGAVVMVISRSGRSVEIVQLLEKARSAGVTVIGITNAPNGALAREAQIPMVIPIALDHAISVNTYTTLALAAGMLAAAVVGTLKGPVRESLLGAFDETVRAIPDWQQQLENSAWLVLGSTTYFLSRGTSLGSAQEARLMWEEGVKSPATAMASASFRHGPQEIVGAAGVRGAATDGSGGAGAIAMSAAEKGTRPMRFGIWIDAERMREQDVALARDLRQLGTGVMLVGQNVPADSGDLVFNLPVFPAEWQFVIDIIPAQLAAEKLARLSGVDPDTFRLCSFVVDEDGGLLPKRAAGETS